jgi:hypothetical protein
MACLAAGVQDMQDSTSTSHTDFETSQNVDMKDQYGTAEVPIGSILTADLPHWTVQRLQGLRA